jgi:hypothetical protein
MTVAIITSMVAAPRMGGNGKRLINFVVIGPLFSGFGVYEFAQRLSRSANFRHKEEAFSRGSRNSLVRESLASGVGVACWLTITWTGNTGGLRIAACVSLVLMRACATPLNPSTGYDRRGKYVFIVRTPSSYVPFFNEFVVADMTRRVTSRVIRSLAAGPLTGEATSIVS